MAWTDKEEELVAAIKAGSILDTKKALEAGADVNAKEHYKCTPLMYACANQNITPEIIQLLLDHDADINAKACDGMTALMYACKNEHAKPEILHKAIELLVKYKADLNEINKDDWTALMYGLNNTNVAQKTNKLLVEKGADINHHYCWSREGLLRMEQKLNAIQREMIADMTKDITELKSQQARNKFQEKNREKGRLWAVRLRRGRGCK